MIAALRNLLRHGCMHSATTFPIRGRERCLCCGRYRFRTLTTIRSDWTRDAELREVQQ